jgi:Polyketide cyclase / dehydrase and lipid transport
MRVVRQSVEIARSPEDVFAYVTDPTKLSTWQDAQEVSQLTPGPVGPGTRFREVHKVLGIRRVEVTESSSSSLAAGLTSASSRALRWTDAGTSSPRVPARG